MEERRSDDPDEIGGYRVRGRLGAGGMGTVYLAYTPGGQPVALKVIRGEYADDAEFRRRFTREVEAARRVHGPYTAAVLDSDTEAVRPWLASAYVPGPALGTAVTEHGPLPPATVLQLVAGVAEALQAIHGAGLVHRDLKPSNVLLAPDGPRVIDFGIARAVEATALTGPDGRPGTPNFMAPEQITSGEITPALDVFALGLLAHHAATGEHPFGKGPSHALLYRIVSEEPRLSGCPEPVRDLVSHCLAKEPGERPTPAEVIELCRQRATGGSLERDHRGWLPPAMTAGQAASVASTGGPTTDREPPGPPAPTDVSTASAASPPQPSRPAPPTPQASPPPQPPTAPPTYDTPGTPTPSPAIHPSPGAPSTSPPRHAMPQALIVPPPPHPTTSPVPVPRRSGRSRLRVAGAALAALVVVGGAAFLIPQLVADGDDGKDQPAQAHKGDAVSRYARPLGDILVAGKPVTGSQRLPSGKYHYRRTYTDGPEYAAVTGYNSMAFGAAGLEGVYRDVLDGTDDRLSAPGDVVTTIDPKVQDAAYQALGGVTGAAVVIDPASGAILGLASTPSYDPGSFSGRTGSDQTAWKKATGDKAKPMLDRALLQTYPPGAAFELVVTAAALDKGLYTSLDEPTESPSPYVLPGSTTTVQNGTDAPCGNVSLRTALRESCNNVFAKAAADLGADKVRGMAEKFGFNTELRVPVHANQSEFPKDINPAETALSGLGQFSVTATPLQMAMVSAALENDGSLLAPRLVARVTDGTGKTIEEDERRSLARPVSARTAEALRGAMTDVVEHGAGAPARIDGAEVGGVPGGVVDNGHPASCFTSYARSSDGAGQVVVAVVVEGDTAHGDRAPASIARQIMKAALG